MQPFGIRMDMRAIKRQFVKPTAVITPLERAELRGLKRVGAATRTIARRSMRRGGRKKSVSQFDPVLRRLVSEQQQAGIRTGELDILPWPVRTSKPGRPPLTRSRRIRDNVFFIASLQQRSVIIGPQIYDGKDVPGLLEFGGTAEAGTWVTIWENGRPKIRLAKGRRKRVKVEPRPFMRPAYDKALDDLVPDIWRNSI